MHLEVSFRNLRPREEIRRRAQALYDKLERFLDPAAEGQLIVAAEHGATVVEAVVRTLGHTHRIDEEDEDLRTALDRTFHRLEKSLRRQKERRVDRWHDGEGRAEGATDGFVKDAASDDLEDELEDTAVFTAPV